jgi:nucleoside-diphosphate-sugar epimerase
LAVSREVGEQVETYNVAPAPVQMRDVVEGLALALGRRPPQLPVPAWAARSLLATAARFTPTRPWAERLQGTVEKWLREDVFDGSKFFRDLGFEPAVSLDVGLRREVAWHQQTVISEQRCKAA